MSRTVEMETHRFFCTKCGREGIPVVRRRDRRRELMHLKKLHCIYCNEEINHVEISPEGLYEVSDFEKDFTIGKFKGV